MWYRVLAITVVLFAISIPSFADNTGMDNPGAFHFKLFSERTHFDPSARYTNQTYKGSDRDPLAERGYERGTGFGAGPARTFKQRFLTPMDSLGSSLLVRRDSYFQTLLVNGAYDFNLGKGWSTYVGFGMGVAWNDPPLDNMQGLPTGLSNQDGDLTFAYQVLSGFKYPLLDNLDFNLGYRYFTTADSDYGAGKSELDTHNLEFGLRFNF